MVQKPQQLRLVDEHADEFGVAAVLGEDPLDHDVAAKSTRSDRARLEDLRHAADPERLHQLVATERGHPVTPPADLAIDLTSAHEPTPQHDPRCLPS